MTQKPKVYLSQKKVLKAIPGSGGFINRIAQRLNCRDASLRKALKRSGWEEVIDAILEEKERLGDVAENKILEAIEQDEDLSEATKNARWYLEKQHKDRGYGKENKITLEGGETPIQMHQALIPIPIDLLSLEQKRKLLTDMDKKEEDEKPQQ